MKCTSTSEISDMRFEPTYCGRDPDERELSLYRRDTVLVLSHSLAVVLSVSDMAIQNVVGDSFRGATWVAIHNGGGVGW